MSGTGDRHRHTLDYIDGSFEYTILMDSLKARVDAAAHLAAIERRMELKLRISRRNTLMMPIRHLRTWLPI